MAEGNQIVDVIIILSFHHNIDNGIEYGAFFHGRFGRGCVDIMLDFLRDPIHPIHVDNLLADLFLIFLDPLIRINLLSIEVWHDLDGTLAKDVLFENVAQGGLGIHRKDENLFALLGQPVSRGSGECGFPQSTFSPVHHVFPIRVFLEHLCQRHGNLLGTRQNQRGSTNGLETREGLPVLSVRREETKTPFLEAAGVGLF